VSNDDLLKIAIAALVLGVGLVSRLVKARRGSQVDAPAAASTSAPAPPSAPQQRVAALLAEMQRRGITPPPALQAIAAREGLPATGSPAYAPTPAYSAPPAYAAPPAQPKQRHQRAAAPPDRPRAEAPDLAAAFPAAGAFARPAAHAGATGRMLARAFSDPARARNAVILAEVLAPPVALR
jgi:hypothetical protein